MIGREDREGKHDSESEGDKESKGKYDDTPNVLQGLMFEPDEIPT